ncbi:MAG: hypothetical protein AAGU32_14070 [Bacillota bacterium]
MTNAQALEKAERRLTMCGYQYETLNNAGLAEVYRREAEWLHIVLYLAKQAAQAGEGVRDG